MFSREKRASLRFKNGCDRETYAISSKPAIFTVTRSPSEPFDRLNCRLPSINDNRCSLSAEITNAGLLDQSMKIRNALPADLNSIIVRWRAMIEEHAIIEPIYTLREGGENEALVHFRNMISDENKLLIVAEDSNQIAGYLAASTRMMPPVFDRQRIGLISELCVSPEVRRQGIGQSLFEHAREWLLRNGIQRIEVRTLIGNQESTAFWMSVGFEPYAAEYRLKVAT